jgi:calcineurin-like phosphoesterase family protein
MILSKAHIAIISLVFLASCGTGKKVIESSATNAETAALVEDLKRIDDQEIRSFFTKASTNYKDSSRNVNFKTSIRSVLDSIINFDIKYAAIPLVNAVATKDSLKVVNRRDKCWILSDISGLREQFGVDFSLNDLEDVLIGRPFGFDINKDYFQFDGGAGYVLSTHTKKEIKRIEKEGEEAILVRYFLNKDRNELKQVIVESTKEKATIVIDYPEWETIGDIRVPLGFLMDIKIDKKKPIKIEMTYSKTRLNESEEIYFVIPEDYENCMAD